MSNPDFIVHNRRDSVGVAVVETIKPGDRLVGWIMGNDDTLVIEAGDVIPLGHKIALVDLSPGDTVLKYGEDIGRVVAATAKGQHVHVHNLKTKRW